MKRPETDAYIAKARQSLKEARVLAANDLSDAAQVIDTAVHFVDSLVLILAA